MSRRAKVLFMTHEQFARLMRGEYAGVRNWPRDATLAAIDNVKDQTGKPGIGMRIHCAQFEPVPHGEPLPTAQATFFTRGGEK